MSSRVLDLSHDKNRSNHINTAKRFSEIRDSMRLSRASSALADDEENHIKEEELVEDESSDDEMPFDKAEEVKEDTSEKVEDE